MVKTLIGQIKNDRQYPTDIFYYPKSNLFLAFSEWEMTYSFSHKELNYFKLTDYFGEEKEITVVYNSEKDEVIMYIWTILRQIELILEEEEEDIFKKMCRMAISNLK